MFIVFVPQNQDKRPAQVRSTVQRHDKIWFFAPFACIKTWLCLKNNQAEVIQCFLYKLKTGCQWQLVSAFAWCCLRWPWATYPANARADTSKRTCFLCRCPRACMRHNHFCLVFSKKFNIMSAFLFTNRPPCRKKSILAKVCFDAKRGQHVNAAKWIFI